MAEFRLLGPVEVWSDGTAVDIGPPRQRSVLAALLVDAGRPVAWETLVDRVWDRTPPEGARHALHTHIARIRRGLAGVEVAGRPVTVVHRSGGYVLEIDPQAVDVHRFRALVERARDPALTEPERIPPLRAALALWRAEPLAGLTGQWASRLRDVWRGQQVDAAVLWARAELVAGDPASVIGPLTELLAERPLVESLSAALMRALHAVGRTADALDCYARTWRRLVDELGTEPGPELRAVHLEILRDNEPEPAPRPPPHTVPAQLPLDVPGFSGRVAELAQLDAALAVGGEHPAAVVISALLGTAGVGKTALAVHWAHTVADQFPDGQLYANLRGFDPGGTRLDPVEAVRGFLQGLGVPAARIPAGTEEQVALYRSVLAGRRVLVLLDNARDAEQVRPLLPGTPGCLVVVTSRSGLTSLIAAECAVPVALDLLPPAEARQLLSRRLGEARLAAEPAAVDDIIRRCARLPLALALVAARAAAHPDFPLRTLAAELRDAGGGLDMLAGGDAATDVRAVFSWSYAALSAPAAQLFRLLGLHPGPDVSVAAAASLAGWPVGRVRGLLGELARAHLLAEPVPGRFTAHDLLRAYAAELADAVDGDPACRAALRRMLDYYLHSAVAAARLLQPHREQISPAPPLDGVAVEELTDHVRALEWFRAEHRVLLAAQLLAAQSGLDDQTWQFAWAMETFLHRQGHVHDKIATQTAALDAARRTGNLAGQASAHRSLGRASAMLADYRAAHAGFGHALELFERVGDAAELARTLLEFANVVESQGNHADALAYAERALPIYRETGNRAGLAYALNAVGWYNARLGDLERAASCCEQALEVHREVADRYGEAAALDSVGYAHHKSGRHDLGLDCFHQSVTLLRALGARYYEAVVLTHLADAQRAVGDVAAAEQAWREALAIFEELDHPDADRVRADLRTLARSTPTPPGADRAG